MKLSSGDTRNEFHAQPIPKDKQQGKIKQPQPKPSSDIPFPVPPIFYEHEYENERVQLQLDRKAKRQIGKISERMMVMVNVDGQQSHRKCQYIKLPPFQFKLEAIREQSQ